MGTYAITGSASGIGAATANRLRAAGHDVIGVDRVDADVIADLGTPDGRRAAVAAVAERCDGRLAGFVPCAGMAGLPGRPGSLLVSVNYYGAVEMIVGLRDPLAAAAGAVVAISSNSTTCQPGFSLELVDAMLAGEETLARQVADEADSLMAYPATKTAIARWIRRHATAPEWIGAGVRLNAVSPGMVDTPLVEEGRADPTVAPLLDMYPMPMGRAGHPEEIAAAIEFLLVTEFCVGTVLLIDGGTEAMFRPDDWPTRWNP
ncbi:MAG: SDR family oxidoreductase [Frankiaceae bacterium]|nr:SDR family oxidoreductase [Frankiaceae bacterium]MBV9870509.1 SDR family oxidoreductase [Frankiaceae bacterium]